MSQDNDKTKELLNWEERFLSSYLYSFIDNILDINRSLIKENNEHFIDLNKKYNNQCTSTVP